MTKTLKSIRGTAGFLILVLVAVLSLFSGLPGLAEAETLPDWPQWRGQNRDGRSTDTGLLTKWPAGGPPLAWKTSGLGGGYSSVSVAGDRVYTMGDLGDGQYVFAVGRADGAPAWKTKIGPVWEDEYLGSRGTPTVDDDRLYVINTEGDVICLQIADGKEIWRRSLPADFGGTLMKAMGTTDWKFAESPLVDGDRVIVTPGAKTAALVALDKMTGKEIWRTSIPGLGEGGADGAGYSSVVISEGGGVRQYVQLIGRGLIGVEAKTGRFLWGYNRVANAIANIATPLIDGNYVFASTGYRTGSVLLELASKEGGGVEAKEVYFLDAPTLQNHHGGLILDRGHIYTGTGHNKGIPISVELATGKVAWGPVRNEGKSSAAIAYADGHIYFRYQNGLMMLIEATTEGYRETGSFMIPGVKRESWSHPVVVGGRLYLKEQGDLYSYDVSAKGAAQ